MAGVLVPETSWDFVNYQAGLVYKPTAHTSVYASYSTSSTPPTIAGGDQNAGSGVGTGNLVNVLLEPEDTTSYEIGGKLSLFRQQLHAQAEHAAGEAQLSGGKADIAVRVLQRLDDHLVFHRVDLAFEADAEAGAGLAGGLQRRRQVVAVDDVVVGQDHRPLDDVFQLAHVAGPFHR